MQPVSGVTMYPPGQRSHIISAPITVHNSSFVHPPLFSHPSPGNKINKQVNK